MTQNKVVLNEFKELQDTMTDDIQNLTTNLVLATNKASSQLFPDEELANYVNQSKSLTYKINSCFVNIISLFNKAYSNIQNNIDESIDGLAEIMYEHDERFNELNAKLDLLTSALTYTEPSNDYTTIARYMIDNVKVANGQSIKGKTITIQNLAIILMKYDELKKYHEANKHKRK